MAGIEYPPDAPLGVYPGDDLPVDPWTPERIEKLPEWCRKHLHEHLGDAEGLAFGRHFVAEVRRDGGRFAPTLLAEAVRYVGLLIRRGQSPRKSLKGWIVTLHDSWLLEHSGRVPPDVAETLRRAFEPAPMQNGPGPNDPPPVASVILPPGEARSLAEQLKAAVRKAMAESRAAGVSSHAC